MGYHISFIGDDDEGYKYGSCSTSDVKLTKEAVDSLRQAIMKEYGFASVVILNAIKYDQV